MVCAFLWEVVYTMETVETLKSINIKHAISYITLFL